MGHGDAGGDGVPAGPEPLGHAFAGIVVSDRFAAYNHLPIDQRQLCWAHLIRDLTVIEQRPGGSGEIGMALLALQRQLFEQWNDRNVGQNNHQQLQDSCLPIRLAFEATLQRVVDLGCERGERTPWAQTVSTCRQLAQCQLALWTFLEKPEIEPTNNAAERALRQPVIHRKISHAVQSASGATCRSRLLTVTATLRQQGRDVWSFLEQAWIAQRLGGVMPSLVPDR
ncbi:transposase [Synechococcus sp. 1G10]|uniref:IS66 family transposase n=1 Tax=Synechococcus sp. 1G10 TaxID=2025605 RepID=UPI000B985C03|nr:transposase [Synechococcus sp. 1G10]